MNRSISRFASIVLLLAGISAAAFGQWVQTNGPEGGGIPGLFADGTDLYAGCYGNAGVFKSTDDGGSWDQMINGMGYQSTVAMARIGSYLLASGTVGLYRSTDSAATWTAATGLPGGSGVFKLLVDGGIVYAGTSGKGIYVSTDSGATWTAANTGLPVSFGFTYVGGMTLAATGILAAVTDNSTYGIYRSTDAGGSWTKIDNGLPAFTQLNCLVRDGSTLLGGGPTVYKSTDDGANWTASGTGIPFGVGISGIEVAGSNIYAAAFNSMYRSTDGGASWSALGGGLPLMTMTSVEASGSTVYAGTIANGIYASTDNGDTWEQRVTGLFARDMTEFHVDGGTLYGNGNGIFSTTDGGDTWNVVRGDLKDSSAQPTLVYVNGATMFCRDFPAPGIERSTDGGATWMEVGAGLPPFGSVTSMVEAGGDLFTVSNHVYRSTDNGSTWSQAESLPGLFMSGIAEVNGTLFAYGNGLARSTDDGATWTRADTGIPDFFAIVGVTSVGSTLFTGGGFPPTNYKSTDNGDTWTPIATLPSSSSAHALLGFGNDLFACAENNGIFISTNLGGSWTKISTGLPTPNYRYSFAIHNGTMYAGTSGNSVWKRPLSQVTAVEPVDERVPSRFALLGNYPNPFNPSTEIRFAAAEAGRVTVEIYNVLGRREAVLVDGRLSPGTYSVRWDAGGLPSGVYYCRLTAPGVSTTKNLLLVK